MPRSASQLSPLVLWLPCLVFFFASARANAATTTLSQGYQLRCWQTEDGLPQNTVTAIAQSPDGYIWVGTFAGLARFDGVRFVVYDSSSSPRLSNTRISALFASDDGDVWIGHDNGQVTRFDRTGFRPVQSPENTRSSVSTFIGGDGNPIRSVHADGTVLDLSRSTSALSANLHASSARSRVAAKNADALFSFGANAAIFHEGEPQQLLFGNARRSDYIWGVGAARGDGWWIIWDNQIRRWSNDRWEEDRGAWEPEETNATVELQDGTLAVATMDKGLILIPHAAERVSFTYESVRLPNWVRVLFEDREGTLWIGAGTGGLFALRASPLSVLNPPDNWQGCTTLAITASRDGSLWVGTEGAGVYRHRDGGWERFGSESGLENVYVWSLAEDTRGTIWAGTWAGGVYRFEGNRFEPVPEFKGIDAPVFSFHFDAASNRTWVGTGKGLFFGGEGMASATAVGDRIPILDIARDQAGALWVALGENGLGQIADGALKRIASEDGLVGNGVQCLRPSGDGLWIGTREGALNRLQKSRFFGVRLQDGLGGKMICHLVEDADRNLWMSTHRGLLRLAPEEFDRAQDSGMAVATVQAFDRSDGLATLEYSGGMQSAGTKSKDGKIWFTSAHGVVEITPGRVSPVSHPPEVLIESKRVDGRVRPFERLEETAIAPHHERIEFDYTAPSFAAPLKLKFRYRLVGLDKEWIDAGDRRTASYSQLPAGDYRFEVAASQDEVKWSKAAAVDFTVRPFFWQTWWFQTAVAACTLGCVAWAARHITRSRMQRRLAALEQEHRLERERARIAQDIHDDIGASMTRITMLSQAGDTKLPPVNGNLARIHQTALEITRSVDEIVWALNPRHDSLRSLANYLARFAQERLDEAKISCRLDMPLHLPEMPLTVQVRHHLLLAFKEAINNVIKHAGASEVRVSLRFENEKLDLVVEDNGRGFSLPNGGNGPGNGGGNGLNNLRARLAAIGGDCEIRSGEGKGSRIAFSIRLAQVISPATAP